MIHLESNSIFFFDTNFRNCTLIEAGSSIEDQIVQKQKFRYYAVKDVALTVRSLEDDFLNHFYKSVPYEIFIDGKGLLYASYLLRHKVKEMIGGPGIYFEILKRADLKGYKVFFLGSDQKTLEKAIKNVVERHSNITIAGFHNGYFKKEEEVSIINQINESNPDIVFLGISTPKRELFINDNLTLFKPYVCIAIGGVLDNEAGIRKFAPAIVSNLGLEWLYRALQEPKRLFKRYLYTHSKFIKYLFLEAKK